MKKNILSLLIILTIVIVAGCHNNRPDQYAQLVERNHKAGAALVNFVNTKIDTRPILVASFVNIDDLSDTSSFGRISAQQVATPFTLAGYNIEEMLLRKNVYIKQRSGEFMLSRELKDISAAHNAQAVLVGTYAIGGQYIYVTTKVVSSTTTSVLASYDYKVPIDEDVEAMINNYKKKNTF